MRGGRYYEASTHSRLPGGVEERRREVEKRVESLEIKEVDEHTGRPMRFGFGEEGEKVPVVPMASPRLRCAQMFTLISPAF